ncbi:methanogen output domain 1-containing protein [Aurantimonas sp. MSK8Z-1]|uniref:methanogen output domain 1-containing protein n=1 Tax=Mangrovibrevibacter kandeliae TaxID=2968473 RepID=UPI0021172DDD|nr:methanogen output domain 1-containing protein [Aurantimonas sp. MSK8Z-1]MCW4114434.1 methanogen output domain 1-containing protein [Aurantimonas sp. MSK8Z-1]
MHPETTRSRAIEEAGIDLDSDSFMRRLLRELSGTIERVVGLEDASGYVATVGGVMGDWLNAAYHAELGEADFDLETVAQVFVDLKRRIDGGFAVVAVEPDRIVLRNTRCPFGPSVFGRPSLCMMTSNVFGRIAADNLGYARVKLHQVIASGAAQCEVTVHLRPRGSLQADEREYYRLPPVANRIDAAR